MKVDLKTYGEKLLSKDGKVRVAAIDQLAKSEDKKEVEFLIGTVFKKRPPNGVSLVIRAIGNSRNAHGIQPLIDGYGNASHDERELVMDCLLKLDVFIKFFPGVQTSKNIREKLWPMLGGLNSSQLKNVLALSPEKFQEQLDFAWKTTSHWRKKA
ncbi:MAG TPA: hypothetical protein VK826_16485 [Bacteroidia bacterium]|nr:hypothetical protein [Bacteroidia bacterium]